MIQFRKDNLAYFVRSTGNPCDKGAKDLIGFNKIERNETSKEISVTYTEKGSKTNHFDLCIRGENQESISNILKDKYIVLQQLILLLKIKYLNNSRF